ncbi:disulfide bond formation protein DsbB [Parashewanella curva]|uniref:Disulfide bond formation protein B n=1 Tax=Parashewanella curva TaxID=2338552 RepID=A0A3L8Q3I3_9GAMM|nr:disulfide bond formation protein DsbB [Parashewanella curva]RLV61262.1 disulfide bond formation protein DsbB [Parashewanella curva]
MELSVKHLVQFTQQRLSWGLLTLSALALEGCALYFQYVMKLDPCVMCIYQRLAILGIALGGIIGLSNPQSRLLRCLGIVVWGVSASWGLKIAIELVQIQVENNPFSTCSFLPDFPSWMPLHEWLPSVFMPTGMCGESQWMFMGVTMAEWMIVVFAIYLAAFALFFQPSLSKTIKKGLSFK